VNMNLSHGNKIVRVSGKDGGKLFEATDGLLTNSTNICLAVLVADCLPIALFDPVSNSYGLIHSGWRGLTAGIIEKAVVKMTHEFGTKSNNLTVYIGAHICQKHYEVKNDVASKFSKYPKAILKKGKKTFLDLDEIARQQFAAVDVKNVTVDKTCTFENKEYFSFRRGDKANRNLYLFGLHIHI